MSIVRIDINERGASQQALTALREDGVAVLSSVLEPDFLRRLKQRMDEDTPRLLDYCKSIGGNPRKPGQLQQASPPFPPYLTAELLWHPFIAQLVMACLGREAGLMFFGGNTNCPGSAPQEVHLDQEHKGTAEAPMRCLVVGIAPEPTSTANGAIEVWPGSHAVVAPRLPTAQQLWSQRQRRPPLQVPTSLGDVIVRDARLWHRAVTNPSSQPRHMLGVVYHAQPKGTVCFDHAARPLLEGLGLQCNALFEDLSEDYLVAPTRWLKLAQAGGARPEEKLARPLTEL